MKNVITKKEQEHLQSENAPHTYQTDRINKTWNKEKMICSALLILTDALCQKPILQEIFAKTMMLQNDLKCIKGDILHMNFITTFKKFRNELQHPDCFRCPQ